MATDVLTVYSLLLLLLVRHWELRLHLPARVIETVAVNSYIFRIFLTVKFTVIVRCFICLMCRSLTTLPQTDGDAKTSSNVAAAKGQRLYVQDGMIPNYTGYLPRMYVWTICHT